MEDLANLCCGICMDILKDPRQCCNGHLFCFVCITQLMKFRSTCPLCNCSLDTLSRNSELELMLQQDVLQCSQQNSNPDNFCDWSGYAHEYENHIKVCKYQWVVCSNATCNKVVQRRFYMRHLARCPMRTFICPYCQSTNVPILQFVHHMQQLCYYRMSFNRRKIPSPMYFNVEKEQYHTASRLCTPAITPTVLVKSSGAVKCVALNSNGIYLAYSEGNTVPVYHTVTGVLMNTISISNSPIDAIAWCPHSSESTDRYSQVAVASGYIVCLVHALSSRIIAMVVSEKKINRVSWDPDGSEGSRLVTSGNHHSFSVWDATTGVLIRSQSCEYQVKCIAWSPNGRYIASGCEQIRIWNANTGVLVNLFPALDLYGPFCVEWSPCSAFLLSTSEGVNIALWSVENGKVIRILEGHCDNVVSLRWSPDGLYIASSSLDKTVRVWEASSGVCVNILKGHTEAVLSLAWSGDSDYLMSGSSDKQLLLW